MSQLSIPTAPKLPAHLSKFANFGLTLNESIVGGMQTGGHPSIGIKQAKFRIREGASEEVVQSFTLKVIIVNANKHLSKVFYAGAYTGEEGKAPDCFSDNGIGPSARAGAPQCSTCALCPHNVWGSKVNPSGAKAKACSDFKKLAIILADDPNRNVYELRVPGASLKPLNEIMSKLINNQVPIPAVIFELSFDPNVDFPKLAFKPLGYVDEDQAQSIERWVGSSEAKEAVGETDVPVQGNVLNQAVLTPTGVKSAPKVITQEDPLGFLNDQPQAQEAPKGRGRPRKTETASRAQDPVQMEFDLPGMQAPAQATPINPAKTDASLDALLAGIL